MRDVFAWLLYGVAVMGIALALIYPFLVAASRADDDLARMRDERLDDE